MAETSIAKARRLAKEKRERGEAEDARAAAAKVEANKPAKKEPSLIDRIRSAFSSDDDISRIDSAVDAMSTGIDDADKDAKRKK